MAGASPEDVLAIAGAGRDREGVPVPGGVAAATANARKRKRKKKKKMKMKRKRKRREEKKKGEGVDGPRAEGVLVIDLTEESSDDEGEEEVKWVGQYSSTHSILLVGDGDFSFSLALATGFGSGANLVATSLDCYDTLSNKYSRAESNLAELKRMGAVTLHGVDVKTMKLHTDLKMRRFDRIVFNFPHAGFMGNEDQPHIIKSHRNLVKDFFRSASLMLRHDGEVHVSHKTAYPFKKWNLEELASEFTLFLAEQVDFHIQDYPGYSNKRGDGRRCNKPFPLGKCGTFKFKIGDIKNKKRRSSKKNKKRRARKLGPIAHSGSGSHFDYRHVDLGPFNPTPLVPETHLPYVASHMPIVPAYPEFFVHEGVERCRLAEAGYTLQPIIVPPGHPWHWHTWSWGSSW